MTFFKTSGIALVAGLVIAGCSREEEPVAMAPAETPIYAKDGTVIGMRPVVGMSGGTMMDDDDDDLSMSAGASMSVDIDGDMDDDDG